MRLGLDSTESLNVWFGKKPTPGDKTQGFFDFAAGALEGLRQLVLAPRDPSAVAFQKQMLEAQEQLERSDDDEAFLKLGEQVAEQAQSFAAHQRNEVDALIGHLDQSIHQLVNTLDHSLAEGEAVAKAARTASRRLASVQDVDSLQELKAIVAKEVAGLTKSAESFKALHAKTTAQFERELSNARARIDEAQAAARTDALTQLPNRVSHELYLAAIIEKARESGPYALAMLDLNGFKNINDTFGHGVGDEALKHFAKTLKSVIGNDGFVARLAGDEFTVVAKTTEPGLLRILREFDSALEAAPMTVEGEAMTLSASYGVIQITGRQDYGAAMKDADERMYEAKRLGKRNRGAA